MMSTQPPREPGDGSVAVDRLPDGKLTICVETDGERQYITMGEYNAWRVFAMLSLMLDIDLPKKITKGIKLG